MTRLVRRCDFSAAHVLARPEWTYERNRRVYGKCANPAGHGHNYTAELVFEGPLDPRTGHLLDPARLDALLRERVIGPLDGRFLNRDVPAFAHAVPTAENIARHIWDTLAGGVSPARLVGVRLIETRNNSVEYGGGEDRP